MKTENSCEFVDLLYIVVYILDEIKFSFTEFSFTELLCASELPFKYQSPKLHKALTSSRSSRVN